ncbi:hypothetical protein QF032_006280 [Streptomyces achromogenes]|nr:hypothetical protein [Streptomyces achromogenes]
MWFCITSRRVPERSEVARPALQAEVFLPQDVDLLDVPAVPYRFQDPVGQAQREQVLDGGEPKDVVDPEHRLFPGGAGHLGEEPVERHGAVEVLTEGLLQGNPASRSEPGGPERGHHRCVQTGGQGQIDRHRLPNTVQQAGEALRIGHLGSPVAHAAQQVLAGCGRYIRGVTLQPLRGCALEGAVVQVLPGGRDDLEAVGEPVRGAECSESRQQVAAGEVTGRTEQHQRLDQLLAPVRRIGSTGQREGAV